MIVGKTQGVDDSKDFLSLKILRVVNIVWQSAIDYEIFLKFLLLLKQGIQDGTGLLKGLQSQSHYSELYDYKNMARIGGSAAISSSLSLLFGLFIPPAAVVTEGIAIAHDCFLTATQTIADPMVARALSNRESTHLKKGLTHQTLDEAISQIIRCVVEEHKVEIYNDLIQRKQTQAFLRSKEKQDKFSTSPAQNKIMPPRANEIFSAPQPSFMQKFIGGYVPLVEVAV